MNKIQVAMFSVALTFLGVAVSIGQPADSPWPMFHYNAQHTGQSPINGPAEPVVCWTYAAGSGVASDPVIDIDGKVYFSAEPAATPLAYSLDGSGTLIRSTTKGSEPSPPGVIFALDAYGTLVWSKTIGTIYSAAPAIGAGGVVYVPSHDDNMFYGLNSADGSVRWSYGATNVSEMFSPVIGSDGSVYMTSWFSFAPKSSVLHAFDSVSSFKWSYRISVGEYGTREGFAPAIGSDGRSYVGDDPNLDALNPDGTLSWSYYNPEPAQACMTISSNGDICAPSYSGVVCTLTSGGGLSWSYNLKWSYDLDLSSPAISSDGRIYTGASDNTLYALTTTGVFSWSYLTGGDASSSSAAIGANGTVYIGSGDNRIYAINSSGSLLWSFITEGSVYSAPAIDGYGRLHIGSEDNKLYCIGVGPHLTATPTATPTETGVPTLTPTVLPATATPTATPIPPLAIVPGTLTTGQTFSLYVALTEDITQPFDFYILADTPAGPYTLYLNGKVKKGITPLYKNVKSFTKDFITTVRPAVKIPASMKGKTITFYSVAVQAGKKPPVRKLSELTPTTQYVILLAKGAAVVN